MYSRPVDLPLLKRDIKRHEAAIRKLKTQTRKAGHKITAKEFAALDRAKSELTTLYSIRAKHRGRVHLGGRSAEVTRSKLKLFLAITLDRYLCKKHLPDFLQKNRRYRYLFWLRD